jgi:hypothetical protein
VDEEKSLWPARAGLVLAIVVATGAGLWLLPDAIHRHAAELQAGEYAGIATMLGERLAVIVAVVFAVLYALFLRSWGLERALTYLAVIAFVAVDADAALVYATKSAGHEQSFQFNSQAVADVRSVVQDFHGFGFNGQDNSDLQARAANDSRIIAGISTNEAAQINRLRASYQAEVSTFLLEGSLKPRGLAAAGGLKRAQARIAEMRELVKKCRGEEQKVFADTRSLVQRAQIDESVRPQMLAAFSRSLQEREFLSAKMWGYEDSILAEADLMVHDLANSQSNWRAEGDVIMFTSHHDLNAYRAHVEKIRAITQTERLVAAQSPDLSVSTVQYPVN